MSCITFKKQHVIGGTALHIKWLQRVADAIASNRVMGAKSCHTGGTLVSGEVWIQTVWL